MFEGLGYAGDTGRDKVTEVGTAGKALILSGFPVLFVVFGPAGGGGGTGIVAALPGSQFRVEGQGAFTAQFLHLQADSFCSSHGLNLTHARRYYNPVAHRANKYACFCMRGGR